MKNDKAELVSAETYSGSLYNMIWNLEANSYFYGILFVIFALTYFTNTTYQIFDKVANGLFYLTSG